MTALLGGGQPCQLGKPTGMSPLGTPWAGGVWVGGTVPAQLAKVPHEHPWERGLPSQDLAKTQGPAAPRQSRQSPPPPPRDSPGPLLVTQSW